MKLIIDTDEGKLIKEIEGRKHIIGLYTKEAFELISHQWLKIGWEQKYSYTFSWLGRPIIQLPEDMIRIQEVIYRMKPDVIIETGIAHGGSLVFYAGLCKTMGKGRVIGVDIEIRPANRKAIEAHDLSHLITLIEGSSIAPQTVKKVKRLIKPSEAVMVILDSNHTRKHVLAELEAYCDLVTTDSYIIAADGIMRDLYDVPKGQSEWCYDNPAHAAADFAHQHPEFILEEPSWLFNETKLSKNVSYWPGGWLRRK